MKRLLIIILIVFIIAISGCIDSERSERIDNYNLENVNYEVMPASNGDVVVLNYYNGSHIEIGGEAPTRGYDLVVNDIFVNDSSLEIHSELVFNKSRYGAVIDQFELVKGDLILRDQVEGVRSINLTVDGVRTSNNVSSISFNTSKSIHTTNLADMPKMTDSIKEDIRNDSSSLVIVELEEDSELPDDLEYNVQGNYGNIREIFIPSDQIRALSTYDNVKNIRKPATPTPDN